MGVFELGYVGLLLTVTKAKHGFRTIGFDVQKEKVDMVNAGKNYISDVTSADLEELVQSGMLYATTDFSFVKEVDYIAIVLSIRATPSSSDITAGLSSMKIHLRLLRKK